MYSYGECYLFNVSRRCNLDAIDLDNIINDDSEESLARNLTYLFEHSDKYSLKLDYNGNLSVETIQKHMGKFSRALFKSVAHSPYVIMSSEFDFIKARNTITLVNYDQYLDYCEANDIFHIWTTNLKISKKIL